jgi:ABC-type oligopeptide transport system ATPase subunit
LSQVHGLIVGKKSKMNLKRNEKRAKTKEAIKKIRKVTKRETKRALKGSFFSGGRPALIWPGAVQMFAKYQKMAKKIEHKKIKIFIPRSKIILN